MCVISCIVYSLTLLISLTAFEIVPQTQKVSNLVADAIHRRGQSCVCSSIYSTFVATATAATECSVRRL